MSDGLLPLGDTGWSVWEWAALRGPGFPAAGLDRLSAPDCAAAADSQVNFPAAFANASARMTGELCAIAADPLFREAVTWQSLNSLEALDGLIRTGPNAPRNSRQRQREIVVTRYWQRYCGKNDTIGFFGPACWAQFTSDGEPARIKAGPELTRERVVDFEWRALTAYADKIHRPRLPVALQPHLALDGDRLLHVGAPAQPLTPAIAALLRAADGRPASEAVAAAGFRTEADGFLALERLVEQGIVRWGIDLPLTIEAERVLRQTIGDDAGFERLSAARDRLAKAASNPDEVRKAMLDLQREFVAQTGGEVEHRPGATYAGRGLAYEETLRDLEVQLGQPVLEALAPALVPLLEAARWLTAAMAAAFVNAMRELCEQEPIPLGDVFHLALGLIFGQTEVLDDFARRWAALLRGEEGAFPATAPGWAAARIHSPDLHLCARDADALARGEFTAVLGELHVAWLTCNGGYLTRFHPSPEKLREALHRDVGDRVILLYPSDFPEFTARIAFTLDSPGDVRLAYTQAPVRENVLPLASLTLSLVDGWPTAKAPDGRSWPIQELFSPFLSSRAVDAFKISSPGSHAPRVTFGRLVVQRETWRSTVGECGLSAKRIDEADAYLTVRQWRTRLGLPERVFVRVGTEIKPCYVDFTSPAYVAAFVAMVRSAQRAGGDDVTLVITEMLPTPDDAWVPDAAGQRYFSELRMAVRDGAR